MTVYNAPFDAMRFALVRAAGFQALCGLSDNEEITPEIIAPILEEAAKSVCRGRENFNSYGDANPPRVEIGNVLMPEEFKKAYLKYIETGINGSAMPKEFGGQGLPHVLSFAVMEIVQSASAAFGLCPMLTQSVVAAVSAHADENLKKLLLPQLVSGKWTGTMNLTEPDAGSDLSSVITKARHNPDGTYTVSGRKIFITYGDHDMAENIIGLVLARVEGAPAGAKGLSLFAVPKFIINEDGTLGKRNAVSCLSIEHKTGIKASPTCVMNYDNAVGYIIGEENRGLEYSFTMMNYARIGVGIQAVGIMERAYQSACIFAHKRIQGRDISGEKPGKVPIVMHPDIKRTLLTIRCATEAARCLTYYAASQYDLSCVSEEKIAGKAKFRSGLLTPAVKAWCSDLAEEMTSAAMRVYGGAGYIKETGIEQLWRDARVLSIYEGANGIQANELVFRRVLGDKGHALRNFIGEMSGFCKEHLEDTSPRTVSFFTQFQEALKRLEEATEYISEKGANNTAAVACAASPYLKMFAVVSAAFVYARSAFRMHEHDGKEYPDEDRLFERVRYFGEIFLPQAIALLPTIKQSYGPIMNALFDEERNT